MITVEATPTEDATVTSLNKEKLLHDNDWWWNSGATIITSLVSTLGLAGAGVFTVVRYFSDRKDARDKQDAEQQAERKKEVDEANRLAEDRKTEREKQAQERFQAAVTGLGEEKEEARVGVAILLRTFLRPEYEQFYTQTVDLAVAHLRLRNVDLTGPLSPLNQALIAAFKEAFPLARDSLKKDPGRSSFSYDKQYLDASRIRLDNAYLAGADLREAWLPQAFLQNATLNKARLDGANLSGAKLNKTYLADANLSGARLNRAYLCSANLSGVKLNKAYLSGANFAGAKLFLADLSDANLSDANLNDADLTNANLSHAYLSRADLSGANFSGTNLSSANLSHVKFLDKVKSWDNADLRGVKGLTSEQLGECEKNGAIVDKDATASIAQLNIVMPPSPHDNDEKVQLTISDENGMSNPDTGDSSAVSSQQVS